MSKLILISEESNKITHKVWSYSYVHGELEIDMGIDLFYVNIDKPKIGIYIGEYQGRQIFIRVYQDDNIPIPSALVCYLDDLEAMKEVIVAETLRFQF